MCVCVEIPWEMDHDVEVSLLIDSLLLFVS
jgi:hypothetical protein